MKTVLRIIMLSMLLGSIFANAAETQTGRYLTIANEPTIEQSDLLSQIVQVRFPPNVKTIDDAIEYLLRLSGYSFVDSNKMPPELKIILTKPLPIVHHELGPVSLQEAVSILVGPAFYLINDDVNRQINFKLKSRFQNRNKIVRN